MTIAELLQDLSAIHSEQQMAATISGLVQKWSSAELGSDCVDPILRFMEAHSEWDFGTPGPFVHFVERFYKRGYEQALIASIERRPTEHTLWMLNRIINGEKDPICRRQLLNSMVRATESATADSAALMAARQFLEFQHQ